MNLFEVGNKINAVKHFAYSGEINNISEFILDVKYLYDNKLYDFDFDDPRKNLFLKSCEHDSIELAQLFIHMGFNINHVDIMNRNGIFIHLNGGQTDLNYNFVKYLIDIGVKVNKDIYNLYHNNFPNTFETTDEEKIYELIIKHYDSNIIDDPLPQHVIETREKLIKSGFVIDFIDN